VDKKRLYNNLIFLILIISVGSFFLLEIIDIFDITFTITLLILTRYTINNHFYKIKKFKKNPATYASMPVPLIISGDIKYESLKQIKKNSFWLINNMEKNHLELENVFYAFYMNQETYFIKKN
jgi:hypothetical protein